MGCDAAARSWALALHGEHTVAKLRRLAELDFACALAAVHQGHRRHTSSLASSRSHSLAMSSFVSLRKHTRPTINRADWHALKGFEQRHPELYRGAAAPACPGHVLKAMVMQANAFNAVFNSRWGAELKMLVEQAKARV